MVPYWNFIGDLLKPNRRILRKKMNLYLRLLFIIFGARKRTPIYQDDMRNEITTRVWFNDLDINLHMNNGRYMTLCDLTRVDLFIRSGLAKLMLKNKWNPIIADHTMTYIRPLKLFDKINVVMNVTHFDEKFFYSDHEFYKGGKLMAKGTSKSLVISKQGSLTPEFILDEVQKAL
jgi:acyl-CoA thioesterase FadM